MKKFLGAILGLLSAVIFPFTIFQLATMPSNVFPYDFLSKSAHATLLKFSLFSLSASTEKSLLALVWIGAITCLAYWLSRQGKFSLVRNTFIVLLAVLILIPAISYAIVLNRQIELKSVVAIECPSQKTPAGQKVENIVFNCEIKATGGITNLTLQPNIFIQPEAEITKNQEFPSVSLGYRFKNINPERSTMISPFNLVDSSAVQISFDGVPISLEHSFQKVFLVIPSLSPGTHTLTLSIPSSLVSDASWRTFHYGIEETGRQFAIARLDLATHKDNKNVFYNKDFGFVHYLIRTDAYDLSSLTSASPVIIARGCMDALMVARPHVLTLERCLSAENLKQMETEGMDTMISRWNTYLGRCFVGDAGEYVVQKISSSKIKIKIQSDYLKSNCEDEIDMTLENGNWKFDQRISS